MSQGIQEIEVTGKNVDAAIAAAEQRFGIPRDSLDIQVVSHGSRGVFGLGGEPARILVRVVAPFEEPATAVVAEEPSRSNAAASTMATRVSPSAEKREPATSSTQDQPATAVLQEEADLADAGRSLLLELLQKMGFSVQVKVRAGSDPIVLDVEGENLGLLIGRRGETLTALQFMVNLILSRRYRNWPHVIVDVQGYRLRREQSLHGLALRVAERVHRNRRPFTLEAMPASDRRIIHLALHDRSDVETYSVGEGVGRRVVVAPRR